MEVKSLARIDSSINVLKFTEEDLKKVEEIKNQIDIQDSNTILQYGMGTQTRISSTADNILGQVRAKDTRYVGEMLTDMVKKVKDLNVDSLSTDKSFFSKIPVLGSLFDEAKKFLTKYDKLSVQIEKLVGELDKARMNLLKDVTVLDSLFDENLENFRELNFYIYAGFLKLQELEEKVLPTLKAKAEESKDPMDAQKYNDFKQLVNRFEKKLHDLKLSKTVSLQTAPQLRIIQSNNQVLAEKIQSSVFNTIPLWKNQIIIAISLFRQHKALEIQKEIAATTDELLRRNAELLKESSIDIAKESEKGIVQIETLKKVNADLISTLEETIRIHDEGKAKREEAAKEMARIESELKQKLLELKG